MHLNSYQITKKLLNDDEIVLSWSVYWNALAYDFSHRSQVYTLRAFCSLNVNIVFVVEKEKGNDEQITEYGDLILSDIWNSNAVVCCPFFSLLCSKLRMVSRQKMMSGFNDAKQQ